MARARGRRLEASWANPGKLKTRKGQNTAAVAGGVIFDLCLRITLTSL